MENTIEKSEILFLYDSTYSVPNGDPFTSEQRYDDETKRILVSDVRIKRFIRDYFIQQNIMEKDKYDVFVFNDKSQIEEGSKESGASARMKSLRLKYGCEKPDKKKPGEEALNLLRKCVDVRLFGGISTEKEAAVNITGPVQFALLNPSLNKVDLRIHQNTSVFSSSVDKSGGAIGTTTVVPYAINQIHGWINAYAARNSGLTSEDIQDMFKALWHSVNNSNTRSKSNQNSVLLLQLVYQTPEDKLYAVDKLISIQSEKGDEQLRGIEEYTFDFTKLAAAIASPKVKEVRYYTEIETIKKALSDLGSDKVQLMNVFK